MAVCWYNTNEPLFSCKNSGSPKRQPFIIDCRIQKMEVFPMSIIIGIDHGYYAIKTAHCSFPAGLTSYGEHEPYTRQGLLEFGGCFFVCGSGRQPIQRDKTVNDNYYLLTLAAIAKEIQQRGLPPECSVRIAAGLPLTSFGRDKPKFRDYLLRSKQPVNFKFRGRGVQHHHRRSCHLSPRLRRPHDRNRAVAGRTVYAPYGFGRLDGGPYAHRQRHPCG